jgi:hypothetical protein
VDLLKQEREKSWFPLLAAIVVAFLVASGIGFALELEDDNEPSPTPVARRSNFEPDEPEIAQAPWKIYSFPSATLGDPTKKQRKAVKRVAPRVQTVVKDLYDALVLSRSQLKEATSRWMTRFSARELRAAPPIPVELSRVKTLRREAKIGIDLRTRSRAAARVEIAFRADQGKKTLSFAHRGTLWLERHKGGWRVIAFDIEQRRRA